MKAFFVAIAALSIASVGFAAPAKVTAKGNVVTVPAGDYEVGTKVIHVAKTAKFALEPAGDVAGRESHKLVADKPVAWLKGTHLEKVKAGGVPLPDCLDPASVHLTLDGKELTKDKDYLFDAKWAGFSRIEGGAIGADAAVTINYKLSQQRIDAIEVDANGVAHLHPGEEKLTCAKPPEAAKGRVAIANIFFPYRATGVEAWQIFPIVEPVMPQPTVDVGLVAKTLAKLRAGSPVTIVTWGDSVTSGGDASSSDKAFAQLFPARLQERFPNSKITAHNAGIGATTSEQRLPNLQKEVLDFHPDLVTIEYVNDMGFHEAELHERYAKIFSQIRATGAEIILITPHFTMPEMMEKPHPRGSETRLAVQVMREIAFEHHVALADTSSRWAHLDLEGLPYITLLHNGINHPDDRGHELFVDDLLLFFPR